MATSLAQEDINFLRLAGLLIKIAPRALRRRFDFEFHPGQLQTFLSKNRRKIDDLYKKRVITLAQHDLLYPRGSSKVSSNMFDVSLMVCLLRHFTDLDIQDSLPLETIHTTAADISRIKFYRNYIVHSDSGKVTENTFSEIRNCVVEAILRLAPDLKSEICALMSSTFTNDSDIIDVLRFEKQMEITNQHLCTVSRKLETLEIENNNKREIHTGTLKEWKEIDTKYISTSATTFILQSLKHNRGVIITGSPGCGKSVTGHHIALQLEKNGYEINLCDDPSEILKHLTTEKIQVFVIEDICGKFVMNQHKADSWEQNHSNFNMLFKFNDDNGDSSSKSDTKFIITCRENIYRHKAFPKLTGFSLVQCSFSTEHKISPDEMRNIALSYLPAVTVNSIENICLYEFSPLLFALYCKKTRQDPRFFVHPVEIIAKEISEMKIKSETSFLCLSILVLKNNKCRKKELISSGMEQLVRAICRDSKMESVITTVSIQKCFEHLEGIYITESDDVYTAIHDKMFDIISAAIAPYIIKCLLESVNIAFIAHRIQLLSCSQTSLPFVIYIPSELKRIYLKRQLKEAMKGKYWEVFGSIQSENKEYRKLFLSFLKEQDSCQKISYVPGKDGATPLFVSSYLGYLDFVEYLLVKCPGHIDVKDKEGRSSFFVACENGHNTMVEYFMKHHHNEINAENAEKTSVLSATCFNGHSDVAQLLLGNNADINKTNKFNQSTIHFASLNGNVKLMRQLLYGDFDVDVTIQDTFGQTALHVACEKGYTDTVKTLVEFGMDIKLKDNIGLTPLYLACKHGCYDTAKYIVDWIYLEKNRTNKTVADELKNLHTTKMGWTVIHAASSNGHTEVVKLLIDAGMNVNDISTNGFTPLFLSCQKGHFVTVKLLLDLNGQTSSSYVDMDLRYEDGLSVLHVACYFGCSEIAKLLIDVGMDVNDTSSEGSTPLYLACLNGHFETVKFLLDSNFQTFYRHVDPTIKQRDGWSVLHAACYYGHTEIVNLLTDAGMNILNDTTHKGSTPLHLACQTGHYNTVKFLLDLKDETLISSLDRTIKDKKGRSVLHAACYSGQTQIVKLLIDVEMNLNETDNFGCTPLYIACLNGHVETVNYLLGLNGEVLNSCVDTTIKNKDGWSGLHKACSNGHTEVVKLLICDGMNVNDTTNNGCTPLLIVCYNGHYETVKYLLDLNGQVMNSCVDTTLKDRDGNSALNASCSAGHLAIVKLLCDISMNANDK